MKIYRTRYRSGHGEPSENVRHPYAYGTSLYAGRPFRYGDVLILNQSAAMYADAAQPLRVTGSLPPRHEPFSHKVRAKTEARDVGTAKRFSTTVRVLHRTATSDPYVALAVAVLERVRSLAQRRGIQPDQQAVNSGAAEIDTWLRAAAEALIERGSDSLQAARDRGRHQALAELQKPDNLTLRDASIYSGRSDGAINEARLKGRLYALVPPGKQRGLRYPQWQFDAEPERLAAVLAPFVQANASCWVVHNFMQNALDGLGGLSPMAWILDASRPIAAVVEAALSRYNADQGAA
ncbi:hypothetical protein M1D55_09370 [Cupriavidus sp. JZ107]